MHNIHDGLALRPSKLAHTLLSVMVDWPEPTEYALNHLRLDRTPHDGRDRCDLALFAALAPILRTTLGEYGGRLAGWRPAITRALTTHHATRDDWRSSIMDAFAIHDTTLCEEGPFKLALAHWNHRGGAGWQHPTAGFAVGVPALPWGAAQRWAREVKVNPTARHDRHHPLRRLAAIEHLARYNAARADMGGVWDCWDHYRRTVAWLARAEAA